MKLDKVTITSNRDKLVLWFLDERDQKSGNYISRDLKDCSIETVLEEVNNLLKASQKKKETYD